MNWYQLDHNQIFAELNTSEHGLTDPEVRERLEKFGPNKLAEEGRISKLHSLFSMNPLGNPFLFFGTIAAFIAHLAAIYLPSMQWIFRLEPIGAMEWMRIGLVSVTVVIAVEIDKWLRRMKILAHV